MQRCHEMGPSLGALESMKTSTCKELTGSGFGVLWVLDCKGFKWRVFQCSRDSSSGLPPICQYALVFFAHSWGLKGTCPENNASLIRTLCNIHFRRGKFLCDCALCRVWSFCSNNFARCCAECHDQYWSQGLVRRGQLNALDKQNVRTLTLQENRMCCLASRCLSSCL